MVFVLCDRNCYVNLRHVVYFEEIREGRIQLKCNISGNTKSFFCDLTPMRLFKLIEEDTAE